MPVPKQRHCRSRSRKRRAWWDKLELKNLASCSRCGAAKLPHRVCPECGWYKDRQVIVKPSETTT